MNYHLATAPEGEEYSEGRLHRGEPPVFRSGRGQMAFATFIGVWIQTLPPVFPSCQEVLSPQQ